MTARRPPAGLVAVIAALASLATALSGCGQTASRHSDERPAVGADAVPLRFERNVGQADGRVRFLAHGEGGSVFLTNDEAVVMSRRAVSSPSDPGGGDAVLRIGLDHASRTAPVRGRELLAGTANYLIGRRRARWHTGVPTYGQVVYRSVYPGIDLRYHGDDGRLEYDFDVAAGGDPHDITIELRGARRLRIDARGNLRVMLATGTIVQRRPVVYQARDNERQLIKGRFVLLGAHRVGFAIGAYDHSRALVIDPTIVYSAPLDGSAPGTGTAIAVDRAGNTYVTGSTSSANLPTAHSIQAHPRSTNASAFVTKIDPAGRIAYSTYLGGSRYTAGRGIAVDDAGNAYVTGATSSTNFPTTPGAAQRSYGGGPYDAFATKIDRSGSAIVYSTLLGDTHYDEGNAIAVDAHGRAVLAGRTVSPQFPVVGTLAPHASSGAFVAKLASNGRRLVSSVVFGGPSAANHGDTAFGVAVDRSGATYATGVTNAADFRTVRALQPVIGGRADAFVVKIDAAGRRVVYATFFGGSGDEVGRAIAADAGGDAYVTGLTTSRDLPTAAAAQAANASLAAGGSDAFVAKLDPDGGALDYSTYLGGGADDSGAGIALDRSRNVYVTGLTSSADFPLMSPLQPALRGPRDAFLAELGHPGSQLLSSTYLGGSGDDAGLGVAVGSGRDVHVTGDTDSADFPRRTILPAGPRRYATAGDGAFVTSLGPLTRGLLGALNRRPLPATGGLPRIAELLRRGGADVRFVAPRPGTVSVTWYTALRPRYRAIVATGRATVRTRGARIVRLRLTSIGSRLLTARRRIVLTVGTAFTARDQLPVRLSRRVVLRR